MCGISGFLSKRGHCLISEKDFITFNNSLKHRGPDGSGIYFDDDAKVFLGHRRLSIIDLSTNANQPYISEDNNFVLVYNGEIFNFLELKETLLKQGVKFFTDSDTEVLLKVIMHYGIEGLNLMNGMWAFALWDKKNRSLFLCRDRYGIKPLFFTNNDEFFAFSSETVSFKSLRGFDRTVNEKNVSFQLNNFASLESQGETIFEDIFQLKPGSYIFIKNSVLESEKKWWHTKDHIKPYSKSFNDAVEEFNELFIDSIKLRLRSDVPVATALSGGLDSSSVYSMVKKLNSNSKSIQRLPSNWQKAFTVSFPNTTLDEIENAEIVVGNKELHKIVVPNTKNLPYELTESLLTFDNFYLTPIEIVSIVYKNMSQNGFKVSLDGHGVDELMFGYTSQIKECISIAQRFSDRDNFYRFKEIYTGFGISDGILTSKFSNNPLVKLKNKTKRLKLIEEVLKRKNKLNWSKNVPWDNWLNKEFHKQYSVFSSPHHDELESPYISLLYKDFHSGLLPVLLRNFDRASMSQGVEIRMPFLDHRIVNFIYSLPVHFLADSGFTKCLLRSTMKNVLDDRIRLNRTKMSLQAPLNYWMSDLKEMFLDEFSSSHFLNSNIWNGNLVKMEAEKIYSEGGFFTTQDVPSKMWTYFNASTIINN